MRKRTKSVIGVFAIASTLMFAMQHRPVVESEASRTISKAPAHGERSAAATKTKGQYAAVNGLKMYYEVHGNGRPLVLLHGGLSTIDTSFGKVLPSLARTHQVIAIELQGHGHTGGMDRPMSFEKMADDVASLLAQLAIDRADVLGYSFGGVVALGTAIRHPHQVNHLIMVGTPNGSDGFEPAVREAIRKTTPENVPKPSKAAYESSAPDARQFPVLVATVAKLLTEFPGWRPEDLRSIGAPTMIIVGDHDFIRPEHAVQMLRLIRNAQLAVLPGAGHDAIIGRHEDVLARVTSFLNAALPVSETSAGE